jgi:hypothetical protein
MLSSPSHRASNDIAEEAIYGERRLKNATITSSIQRLAETEPSLQFKCYHPLGERRGSWKHTL